MTKTSMVSLVALAAGAGMASAQFIDTTPGGATLDGVVSDGEFVAEVASNGNTGFGGQLSPASLLLDSDTDSFDFALSGLGPLFDNSVRIFIDVVDGGFSEISPTTGFTDTVETDGFNGTSLVSNTAAGGITLPFEADFVVLFSPAFGGAGEGPGAPDLISLFALDESFDSNVAPIAGLEFAPVPTGEGDGLVGADVEFSVSLAALGIDPGATINLFALLSSNTGFVSDEAIGLDIPGGNPGFDTVDLSGGTFISFTTVPTPGAAALVGLGGVLAVRRRR